MVVKNKLLQVLFIFIIVLNSGHALQTVYTNMPYLAVLGAILFIGLAILARVRSLNLGAMVALSIIIPILFTMITDFESRNYYLVVICIIIFSYGVTQMFPFEKTVDFYLKLMTVITIIALIGHFLFNNTGLLDFLPRVMNVNKKEYALGVIFNVLTHAPERNCAMFWEPGLFATALTVAMVFEILFKQKPISKLRILLFIAGFITSTSSAGYILCFFCLVLLFTRKITLQTRDILKSVTCVIALVAGALVILNLDSLIQGTALANNEYIAKLLSDNVQSSTRFTAIGHNMNIFSENPIFGAGVTYVNQYIKNYADTSTITHAMSIFGLAGIWYGICWLIGIFRLKNVNFFTKIILFILLMVVLNKEPHLRMVFTWCLLFYTFSNNRTQNEVEPELAGE